MSRYETREVTLYEVVDTENDSVVHRSEHKREVRDIERDLNAQHKARMDHAQRLEDEAFDELQIQISERGAGRDK